VHVLLARSHLAITRKKPAPPDADAFVNVPDKFDKYFSPNPGEGD
jgi:ferredoxin